MASQGNQQSSAENRGTVSSGRRRVQRSYDDVRRVVAKAARDAYQRANLMSSHTEPPVFERITTVRFELIEALVTDHRGNNDLIVEAERYAIDQLERHAVGSKSQSLKDILKY